DQHRLRLQGVGRSEIASGHERNTERAKITGAGQVITGMETFVRRRLLSLNLEAADVVIVTGPWQVGADAAGPYRRQGSEFFHQLVVEPQDRLAILICLLRQRDACCQYVLRTEPRVG